MAKKKEYKCTVEFTEGWQERITQAFVDLYYQRLEGIHGGKREEKKEKASA